MEKAPGPVDRSERLEDFLRKRRSLTSSIIAERVYLPQPLRFISHTSSLPWIFSQHLPHQPKPEHSSSHRADEHAALSFRISESLNVFGTLRFSPFVETICFPHYLEEVLQ
jgi:hypothetical protein